jgi:hypothetical protein
VEVAVKKPGIVSAVLLVWLTGIAPAAASPFFEIGDAGDLTATGQVTNGTSPLTAILGNLIDPVGGDFLDIDLFQIFIFDPFGFSASTVGAPGVHVDDPQLFLFDEAGLGVFMNDDDESGTNGSQSLLPAGDPFGPLVAGLYYLAIGWFDNEPLSQTGMIFSQLNSTGTNGPGAGGGDPLLAWDDNVTARIDLPTAYEIALTGTAPAVPEPGTLLLLTGGIASFLVCRRTARRPRSTVSAPSSRPGPSAGGAPHAGTTDL